MRKKIPLEICLFWMAAFLSLKIFCLYLSFFGSTLCVCGPRVSQSQGQTEFWDPPFDSFCFCISLLSLPPLAMVFLYSVFYSPGWKDWDFFPLPLPCHPAGPSDYIRLQTKSPSAKSPDLRVGNPPGSAWFCSLYCLSGSCYLYYVQSFYLFCSGRSV